MSDVPSATELFDALDRRRKLQELSNDDWLRTMLEIEMIWRDNPINAITMSKEIRELVAGASKILWLAQSLRKLNRVDEVRLGQVDEEGEETLKLLGQASDLTEFYSPRRGERVNAEDEIQGFLVKRARKLGISWRRIGEALGMSAQGAYQKAHDKGWTKEVLQDED